MICMANAKKGVFCSKLFITRKYILLRERVIYLKGYAVFFIKKGCF